MCTNHEHRYRITVTVSQDGYDTDHDVCVYAVGIAKAVAKADGWAFKNFPKADCVSFKTFRTSYNSKECAIDHGAIIE